MMWKLSFVFLLAAGVLCQEYQLGPIESAKIKDVLRDQCKRNGAEDKADSVEAAGKNFVDCVKNLINIATIKKEIEEAKPNGALDEVFGKYCAKSPELKTCIHNLSSAVAPCLESSFRDKMPDINNAADQLLDFVCHKDGDRIALFIAEQGPECFTEKAEPIRECFTKLRDDVRSVEEAKSLTLNQQCAKFDTLTTCIVKALETCSTPTPGNMAESLFKFVRKGSPCKDVKN